MPDAGTKLCRSCGGVKPLTAFYVNRTKPDGRQTYCKDCDKRLANERQLRHRQEDPNHREKKRQYLKAWRADRRASADPSTSRPAVGGEGE